MKRATLHIEGEEPQEIQIIAKDDASMYGIWGLRYRPAPKAVKTLEDQVRHMLLCMDCSPTHFGPATEALCRVLEPIIAELRKR